MSSSTQFRVAVVLGGNGNDNPETFAPALLRVGGIIATADMNGQTSNVLAIFFDKNVAFIDTIVASASSAVTGSSASFTTNII